MKVNVSTLNKIANGLINGEIDINDIENSIASYQGIDNNDEMNRSFVSDIVHDLESIGIIHQQDDGYKLIESNVFVDIAKSDVRNIAYASEEVSHGDTKYTKLYPVDNSRSDFHSRDIVIIGSDETEQPWDETKIDNAKNSNPIEFDFTKCDNIELISPELLTEITYTPGINGDFSTRFPVDKSIFALQGDSSKRMYGDEELVFGDGDAIILNGFSFTYNEELNSFIKKQVAVDTTKESALDSQIPEDIQGFTVFLSQEVADKVLNNEDLTPEDNEFIINPVDNIKTKKDTDKNPHVIYTGNLSASETINEYDKKAKTYFPVHGDDVYEQNLANKLNEIEYRRLEAESKINKIRNEIREEKRKMNRGPWFLKLGRTLFWKPLKFLGRLMKKIFRREINFSQEELRIKDLKEELDKEFKDAIRIEKEQKAYVKTHKIQLDKGDSDIQKTTETPNISEIDNTPINKPTVDIDTNLPDMNIPETNAPKTTDVKDAVNNRVPNVTQIFGNMFQVLCNDYNIDARAYTAKDSDGKYKTFVELSTKDGEITKFDFNQNKGTLEPVSFSVKQVFSPEMIEDLQKKAYISYTLAALKSQKDIVSDKYIDFLNEKHIGPILNGERKETKFKMGNIPVAIKSENGLYKLSLNSNKEKNTNDLVMYVPGDVLQPDNLKTTILGIKSSYALTMYKNFINKQFIDFAKKSSVIENIKNANIVGVTKNNNEITFDIKLSDKESKNDMTAKLKLDANNFGVQTIDKDIEENMTNAQRIAFSKTAAKLEEAYASFIFSKCKIPADIAFPDAMTLSTELNKKIDEVEPKTSKTLYLYGLKIDINKEENEYPVMRISTKDNNILTEMPLYEGELDKTDLESIYYGMANALLTEAKIYDKAEAAILNTENKEINIEDSVLGDNNYDDAYNNDNGIDTENVAIDRIMATLGEEPEH